MAPEKAVACEKCGNEHLIHGLKVGRGNSMLMVGGPGQIPNTMGNQWAVYLCPQCRSILPYNRNHAGTRVIQDELRVIHEMLRNWSNQAADIEDLRSQLESVIESHEVMSSLTGSAPSTTLDALISQALSPVLERLEFVEAELARRKGGRPKHCSVLDCKESQVMKGLCAKHYKEEQTNVTG